LFDWSKLNVTYCCYITSCLSYLDTRDEQTPQVIVFESEMTQVSFVYQLKFLNESHDSAL